MPPKKVDPKKAGAAETVIVPIEGAKFIYIVCGSKESDLKVTANINCRVDIVLDYVRSDVLKTAAAKIAELKALGINAPNANIHSKPGSPKTTSRPISSTSHPAIARPGSPTQNGAPPDPNTLLLEEKLTRLLALQSTLTGSPVSHLDLNEDGGPPMNCKTVSTD
jgi:hypothetical protein